MDTKEAIDFTKRIKHSGNGYGNSYISDFNKLKDVITLLQRGEKYRQMWGELEKEKCLLIDFDDEGYFKGQRKLNDIKQKYFPKLKCPKLPANFTKKVMKKIKKIKKEEKGGE